MVTELSVPPMATVPRDARMVTELSVPPMATVPRDARMVTELSVLPMATVLKDVRMVTELSVLPMATVPKEGRLAIDLLVPPTVIVPRGSRLAIGPPSAIVMRDVRLAIGLPVLPSVIGMTSLLLNAVRVVVPRLLAIANVLKVMHLQGVSVSLLRSHTVSTSSDRQKPVASTRMTPSSGSMTIRRIPTNNSDQYQETPGLSGVF